MNGRCKDCDLWFSTNINTGTGRCRHPNYAVRNWIGTLYTSDYHGCRYFKSASEWTRIVNRPKSAPEKIGVLEALFLLSRL